MLVIEPVPTDVLAWLIEKHVFKNETGDLVVDLIVYQPASSSETR